MLQRLNPRAEYPDSAAAEAQRALQSAAAELSERGLSSSSCWALELAICAGQAVQDSVQNSALLGTRSAPTLTSTPARRPIDLSRPGHSTPATGLAAATASGNGNGNGAAAAAREAHSSIGRLGLSHRPPPSPLSVSHTASNMVIDADDSLADPSTLGQTSSLHVRFAAFSANSSQTGSPLPSSFQSAELVDPHYALAKAYFDDRQYERCSALLGKSTQSRKSQFLRLYADYLTAERQANEQNLLMAKTRSSRADVGTITESRITILEELIDVDDAFLLYLKGLLFRRLNRRIEAMDAFLKSVQAFPYNWSAWQELVNTVENDELEHILDLLPETFMSTFFIEHHSRNNPQTSTTNLERIDSLLTIFPDSAYLLMAKAQNYTIMQQLEDSERIFERVFEIDPFRMDGLADYAHTLFVLDRYDKLAALSDQFAEIGNDHPEVCCLIGNYYNQRGDHHRAIEAFKRALRLDMGCLAAWILLGHEYLELKNSHAAAEMYRRAIDISPNDHRAWHGLGCVYELNGAWSYAAHYFQKCASIRPYDSRMWASLGECYDRLEQTQEAVSCFKRHLTCQTTQDEQVQAIQRIIDLYERIGEHVAAACWHRRMVHVVDQTLTRPDALPLARFVQSYIVAAKWEMGEIAPLKSTAARRAVRDTVPEGRNGGAIGTASAGAGRSGGSTLHPDSAAAAEQAWVSAGLEGDLALADEYLRKVISAKTEYTDQAEKLLQELAYMRDRSLY